MLTLNDGRNELWQWDTGRKLSVDADCSQVHFSNKVFGRSIDVDVIDGYAIIPDILLQTDKDLSVWAFVGTSENGYTKISKTFKVNRRNKPADYVFTPPEQTTLGELVERLGKIEESQDPDAIKNAVDDYLANNPIKVEEKDPTVPEWAKQPTPPDVKIPDKLPNPHSITFTGAVNASYDGSDPVEITIPGSGGNVVYDKAQNLTDEQKAQARENIGAQPAGSYLTKVPEGYAKTEDIPTDEHIIDLIEENAPESSGGGIAVTGATVGQTVKIAAVDENGVPTAWESVDFPSGGGSAENDNDWELINKITFDEEGITAFTINEDKDGNAFELSDVWMRSADSASLGGKINSGARVKLVINEKEVEYHIGNINEAMRIFAAIATLINGRIYYGHTDFVNNTSASAKLPIRPMLNGSQWNDNSISSIGIRINDPGEEYFKVGYYFELWGRRKK